MSCPLIKENKQNNCDRDKCENSNGGKVLSRLGRIICGVLRYHDQSNVCSFETELKRTRCSVEKNDMRVP